jgi:cytochrome c
MTMRRAAAAILLLAASLVPLGLAQAQDPAKRGRALLQEYCAECHAIGRSGDSPDRAALPLRALGRSFDLDRFPHLLERGISSTHPAMPQFKFSSEDAQAVTAYLRSIQQ